MWAIAAGFLMWAIAASVATPLVILSKFSLKMLQEYKRREWWWHQTNTTYSKPQILTRTTELSPTDGDAHQTIFHH